MTSARRGVTTVTVVSIDRIGVNKPSLSSDCVHNAACNRSGGIIEFVEI